MFFGKNCVVFVPLIRWKSWVYLYTFNRETVFQTRSFSGVRNLTLAVDSDTTQRLYHPKRFNQFMRRVFLESFLFTARIESQFVGEVSPTIETIYDRAFPDGQE